MYFTLMVLFQTHSCVYWWDQSLTTHSTCTILETFFSTFKSQEWTKSIFFFYYHNQEKSWWKCVVPENIHSPPTEGIGNSWGVEGGSQRPKNLSKCLNLDWNFQRGGGGGDLRKNPFCGGHMDNCWKHTINFMITYFNGKFFNFETN